MIAQWFAPHFAPTCGSALARPENQHNRSLGRDPCAERTAESIPSREGVVPQSLHPVSDRWTASRAGVPLVVPWRRSRKKGSADQMTAIASSDIKVIERHRNAPGHRPIPLIIAPAGQTSSLAIWTPLSAIGRRAQAQPLWIVRVCPVRTAY